jgi:hypothetical protein
MLRRLRALKGVLVIEVVAGEKLITKTGRELLNG